MLAGAKGLVSLETFETGSRLSLARTGSVVAARPVKCLASVRLATMCVPVPWGVRDGFVSAVGSIELTPVDYGRGPFLRFIDTHS